MLLVRGKRPSLNTQADSIRAKLFISLLFTLPIFMSNFFPFISGLPHHFRPILGLPVSVPQNQFIYSLVICLPMEKNAD